METLIYLFTFIINIIINITLFFANLLPLGLFLNFIDAIWLGAFINILNTYILDNWWILDNSWFWGNVFLFFSVFLYLLGLFVIVIYWLKAVLKWLDTIFIKLTGDVRHKNKAQLEAMFTDLKAKLNIESYWEFKNSKYNYIWKWISFIFWMFSLFKNKSLYKNLLLDDNWKITTDVGFWNLLIWYLLWIFKSAEMPFIKKIKLYIIYIVILLIVFLWVYKTLSEYEVKTYNVNLPQYSYTIDEINDNQTIETKITNIKIKNTSDVINFLQYWLLTNILKTTETNNINCEFKYIEGTEDSTIRSIINLSDCLKWKVNNEVLKEIPLIAQKYLKGEISQYEYVNYLEDLTQLSRLQLYNFLDSALLKSTNETTSFIKNIKMFVLKSINSYSKYQYDVYYEMYEKSQLPVMLKLERLIYYINLVPYFANQEVLVDKNYVYEKLGIKEKIKLSNLNWSGSTNDLDKIEDDVKIPNIEYTYKVFGLLPATPISNSNILNNIYMFFLLAVSLVQTIFVLIFLWLGRAIYLFVNSQIAKQEGSDFDIDIKAETIDFLFRIFIFGFIYYYLMNNVFLTVNLII